MIAHNDGRTPEDYCDGTYIAAIEWTRDASELNRNRYRRTRPLDLEPEEALVAALSSRHLQLFIELAAKFGYIVEHYSDTAEGRIATNSAGSLRVAHVMLQPAILFTGAKVPTDAAVLALHCAAHAENSVADSVCPLVKTMGVWHHERFLGDD